ELDEIDLPRETNRELSLAVEEVLLLIDQAVTAVVEENNLDVQVLFLGGGQCLDVEQKTAVTREADDRLSRVGQRGANGGGKSETHGSEPARGERRARFAEGIGVGNPHLVLADVRGNDCIFSETFSAVTNDPVGSPGIVNAIHLHREIDLQTIDVSEPL